MTSSVNRQVFSFKLWFCLVYLALVQSWTLAQPSTLQIWQDGTKKETILPSDRRFIVSEDAELWELVPDGEAQGSRFLGVADTRFDLNSELTVYVPNFQAVEDPTLKAWVSRMKFTKPFERMCFKVDGGLGLYRESHPEDNLIFLKNFQKVDFFSHKKFNPIPVFRKFPEEDGDRNSRSPFIFRFKKDDVVVGHLMATLEMPFPPMVISQKIFPILVNSQVFVTVMGGDKATWRFLTEKTIPSAWIHIDKKELEESLSQKTYEHFSKVLSKKMTHWSTESGKVFSTLDSTAACLLYALAKSEPSHEDERYSMESQISRLMLDESFSKKEWLSLEPRDQTFQAMGGLLAHGCDIEDLQNQLDLDLKATETFKDLNERYLSGDYQYFENYHVAMGGNQEGFFRSLNQSRHGLWMPQILDLFAKKKLPFIAVHVNHLLGEDGLIALFREEGFEIERLGLTDYK
jgi:uncharacterized protein YbaP (TraB family)